MKILQINACYGYLSTGVIVEDLEKEIYNSDDICYVAYQSANKGPVFGYKIGNKADRLFHGAYARIFGKQGYASKTHTRRLLKWIDSIKPDIIHLHNLHSNYINFNMLCDYISKNNIKTVYTFHDCWAFTGKCSHYTSVNCDKWQTSCGNCPQLKNEVPSLIFDNTNKVLKDKIEHLNKIPDLTIVPCSYWMEEQVKKSLLRPERIVTLYNGVDTELFCSHKNSFREDYNLEDKFIILGFANKWFNSRNSEGVKFLIDNVSRNVIFVILGCNDEQIGYFSKFKNVLPLGFIRDRQLLSDIYSSSDVFVNLTYVDTLPTVNMESICSKTPVITFDSCGSPELISDTTGIVVPAGDFRGILESVNLIKNSKINFNFDDLIIKYNKDLCYKKYIDLYKEIIGD